VRDKRKLASMESRAKKVVGHGNFGISPRFKSSALDFPKDLTSGETVRVRRTGEVLAPCPARIILQGLRLWGPKPQVHFGIFRL
jgi:hypothetical protein